jgi:uncharacterized protein YkwD
VKTKKTNSRKPRSLHTQLRHHAKQILVPHKGNQYRPHLIRRYGLIAAVVVVVGMQFSYNSLRNPSVLGANASLTEPELLADSNAQRVSAHVAPLHYNEQLTRAAYFKAQDMLAKQYWAHVSPDGTTPWQWFGKVGYNYAAAGENLAKNFTSAQTTTSAWMASPEHRKNILNARYTDVGYAVVDGMLDGRATTLIVALYGQPETAASVAGASVSVSAPAKQALNPLTRFGIALQSITPAALGSLLIVAFVTIIALSAHMYREKLPKSLRQSWYRNHGLAKAVGMMSLGVVVLLLSSGGQI